MGISRTRLVLITALVAVPVITVVLAVGVGREVPAVGVDQEVPAPNRDLRVTILTDRAVYPAGEPVHLRIRLQNTATTDLEWESMHIRYEIVDSTGHQVFGFVDDDFHFLKPLTLAPGQETEMAYPLAWHQRTITVRDGEIIGGTASPGTYIIKFEVTSPGSTLRGIGEVSIEIVDAT